MEREKGMGMSGGRKMEGGEGRKRGKLEGGVVVGRREEGS